MATYTFDRVNKIITVDLPATEVTIQELVNTIRAWEDNIPNMDMYKVCDASGKEGLGGGVLVGITLTLIDWKIKFANRPGPTWVLCRITGGNLVAWNSGAEDYVDPIAPAAYVTVSITASSSATLQDLKAIQYSSYQNAVWVNTSGTLSGTDYPAGTREYPVNNIPDATAIAAAKGFDTLQFLNNAIFDTGDNVENFIIYGRNPVQTAFTINSGALTLNCEVHSATISGILDGGTTIKECNIGNLEYVNGEIHNSMLEGTITLGGQANARIINCYSAIRGQGTPTVDLGGSGQGLQVRNYNGGIKLINKTGSESISIDLNSGQIKLGATVTNGIIVCRGIGKLTDDSNGAIINNELIYIPYIVNGVLDEPIIDHVASGTIGAALKLIHDIEGGRWKINRATNVMEFYAADNTTLIASFNLYDQDGNASSDSVHERRRI